MNECFSAECERDGIWVPVLILRKRKEDGPGLRAKLPNVPVCEIHMEASTVETFLSDEGWTKMQRHLREAGKGLFAKELTELQWQPAAGAESEAECLPF